VGVVDGADVDGETDGLVVGDTDGLLVEGGTLGD